MDISVELRVEIPVELCRKIPWKERPGLAGRRDGLLVLGAVWMAVHRSAVNEVGGGRGQHRVGLHEGKDAVGGGLEGGQVVKMCLYIVWVNAWRKEMSVNRW